MAGKEKKTKYDTDLMNDLSDLEATGEDAYSLEEILAEFGSSRGQKILQEVEREAEETLPPELIPAKPALKQKPEPEKKAEEMIPPAPKPVSLEDVVNSTVSAVMEERQEPVMRLQKQRRGLFSRKPMEETEKLYETIAPIPEKKSEVDTIGFEPELSEVAGHYRTRSKKSKQTLVPAFLAAVLPVALMAVEQYGGVTIPIWSTDQTLQAGVSLICLLMNLGLCWGVAEKAIQMLRRRRCVSEQLAVLAALAAVGDSAAYFLSDSRQTVLPYAAVCSVALFLSQWSIYRENRGCWDSYRTAALDENPPYLVTDTPRAACKQRGIVKGFYTTAKRDDFATRWQTALLPVVAMLAIVLAGLTSAAKEHSADFLLHLSAILAAGCTFSLPLCWALPWSHVSRRLQKAGGAVAGWDGAERVSRRRCMIISDGDLFPPGTVQLNGVKVYGEELGHAGAYAAAMAYAAGSGLERLFGGLAIGEGAKQEKADDFSFYQEGGWSATIHGETVLLGTASFMRKMDVRLPGGIDLKTGLFLAIDGELAAVFAVKYVASENVDFALRMLRRSRVLPILAARDPNITPVLMKRKFYKKVRVDFPDLTTRVALSEAEQDSGLPRALLMREGLLPYAEAVVGSRRLCNAVRKATLLSLTGSVIGTLLTAYLVNLQAFALLTPLTLTVFLLLWTLPVLLLSDWASRY